MPELTESDRALLRMAVREAAQGFDEGGVPVGAVLADGDRVLATGRNRRVQNSDPIAHGEMDCLQRAGRLRSYRGLTLYTTLSPCMMCAGTIVQFGIPRVVVGEAENFAGNVDFLRSRGVEVIVVDDAESKALMRRFIAEHPDLWNEDIAEL
jgi:cytosine deaminase